jgi:carboxymethylenebutenolidase
MGEYVRLTASDGHQLDAYVARPEGEPLAGLVIGQEIFGVNAHIRAVSDSYAREGFLAVAPALFDRFERGVDLGYDGADRDKAMTFVPRLDMDFLGRDTAAAAEYARRETGKKTGIVGYCLGGSLAWMAASMGIVDAAVGYYGGFIAKYADAQLKCPIMLHFGKKDAHIPADAIATIAAAHPEVPIFLYDAGHGFNCDMRADYSQSSALLARERSLEFLHKNLDPS